MYTYIRVHLSIFIYLYVYVYYISIQKKTPLFIFRDTMCVEPMHPPSRPQDALRQYSMHPPQGTLLKTPYSRHPNKCTLLNAPYSMHPTQDTLLKAPYSRHPTPSYSTHSLKIGTLGTCTFSHFQNFYTKDHMCASYGRVTHFCWKEALLRKCTTFLWSYRDSFADLQGSF